MSSLNAFSAGIDFKRNTHQRDCPRDVQLRQFFKHAFWSLQRHTTAATYASAIGNAIIFKTFLLLVIVPHMSRCTSRCCMESHAIFATVVAILVACLIALANAFALECFASRRHILSFMDVRIWTPTFFRIHYGHINIFSKKIQVYAICTLTSIRDRSNTCDVNNHCSWSAVCGCSKNH